MLQQLNQPDTVVEAYNNTVETTQIIPLTSKTVLSQQFA